MIDLPIPNSLPRSKRITEARIKYCGEMSNMRSFEGRRYKAWIAEYYRQQWILAGINTLLLGAHQP